MKKTKGCNCLQEEFDAKQSYENLNSKLIVLAKLLRDIADPSKKDSKSLNNSTIDRIKRIIGGDDVLPGGFPECCSIGISSMNGVDWRCTGILIHKRVVLTAGHCFSPYAKFEVALNTTSLHDLEHAERIAVKKAILHPNYDDTYLSNDLCVMVLSNDASTRSVPAASSKEINEATQIQLVGFGNHDSDGKLGLGIKREVGVPITSIKREIRNDVAEDEYKYAYNSDLEFVAGENGYGSCFGDSGGPAYIMVDGIRKVAGITSRGAGGQHSCGNGAVYTRIDVYANFIEDSFQKYQ